MQKPAVCVIVPVWGAEKTLSRCVESILSQQVEGGLCCVLVDDGSPDNCGAMCDEYARRDPRVTALHKEDGGVSTARNAGLDLAYADYVVFLDSDDALRPGALQAALDAQAADPDRAALQIVNPGPQSREAPAGGPDILGVREAVDDTGPAAGESRRNQQPVGLALGGRRGDGPPQLCRCNRDVHSATSTKARRPSISRGTVLAWPISSSTTTSMVPPRRFLSPVAASYNSAAV